MNRNIVFLFFLPLIFLLFSFSVLFGQNVRLENASFEGEPQDATMPQSWHGCIRGSTPDILPGFWGVYLEPSDGSSYVGLITRGDGSYENIGQRLVKPLKKKECYSFSVQLALGRPYARYDLPIRFRVYGGTTRCQKSQLLAESPTITHSNWQKYDFRFVAKEEYNYIIFEAYFAKGISFPYGGNVLIDGVSVLKMCPRALVD